MLLSNVRSSETSAQNARGKNFQKFTCSNFRGSYFRVLVVGRENRENLDLAKISRYTVFTPQYTITNRLYSNMLEKQEENNWFISEFFCWTFDSLNFTSKGGEFNVT